MMNLQHRYLIVIALTTCFVCSSTLAASAIEHHVWQDKRKFEPFSRTAISITGAIRLSGNPNFASTGSKMTITFENGKKATLTSVGASWRIWDDGASDKTTAEVFKISQDPGTLKYGNTLCGDSKHDQAKYIVFLEKSFGDSLLLGMAIFESKQVPHDINSQGLCGTFNYSVD